MIPELQHNFSFTYVEQISNDISQGPKIWNALIKVIKGMIISESVMQAQSRQVN